MVPTWRFVSHCVGVAYGQTLVCSIVLAFALTGLPGTGHGQGFMPAGSGQVDLPDETAPSNEVRLHASEPRQPEPEPTREAPARVRDEGPSAEQKHAAAEARKAAARQRAEVQKLEKTVTDLQHEMDDWHAQAVKRLSDDGGASPSTGVGVGPGNGPNGDGTGDPRLKAYDENLPVSPTPGTSPDANGGSAGRRMMDRLFASSPNPDTSAPPPPAANAPTTGDGEAGGVVEDIERFHRNVPIAPNFPNNATQGMDAVTRGVNAVTGGDGMIQEGDSPTP